MDLSRVYTKTSKGILEGNAKSRDLTREHGRLLALIDGKSSVSDLLEKNSRLSESRLAAILDELAELGMIRQLNGALAVDDLGFSSTIIVGEANTQAFFEAQAHLERELRRAEDHEVRVKEQDRTTLLNEVKADIEAEAETIKRELAERNAREAAAAQAKAQAVARHEAEEQSRREAEAKAQATENARQAREEAEVFARAEVARKAKQEAAQRAEAEAHARMEAEKKAREQAEKQALVAEKAREAAERKAHKETEENARLAKEAEEKTNARRELEAKIQAEEEAQRRAEMEARMREMEQGKRRVEEEAKALAKALDEARIATELETRVKRRMEARAREDEEVRQRAEAEARAKLEEESRLRLVAEARARAEAEAHRLAEEAKIKAEQEAQAKLEVERLARKEAEARAITEAEVQRQAEAARLAAERRAEEERRAREEAERVTQEEADARVKTEEEARQRAEAEQRRIEEAEAQAAEQARLAAEQRAEEERKVREEAEREARAMAEARAKAEEEAQRRADEERLRAEAEARAVAEAEEAVRLEAEAVKRQLEAQQRVEESRLEREAAARQQEVERAAAEAARALAEARERAEAEVRAQDEARQQAREAAEAAARAEAEEALRRVEEAARREEAEEARLRAEAQARAMAAAQGEAVFPFLTSRKRTRIRFDKKLIKPAVYGVLGLLVFALAALHLISFNFYIPKLERQLTESLGQRVVVKDIRFSVYPAPHLKLEGVALGDLAAVRIGTARLFPAFSSWFSEAKAMRRVELESVTLSEDSVSALSVWSQHQAQAAPVQFEQVLVKDAKLANRLLDLFAFDADVKMDHGRFAKAQIKSTDQHITIDFTPQADALAIQLAATRSVLPLEPRIQFDELKISAIARPGSMTLSHIEGQLYGGSLSGSAQVEWRDGWILTSDLGVRQVAIEPALTLFTHNMKASGALEAKIRLTTKSAALETLFSAPQVQATFRVRDGELSGVDLVRAIQSARSSGNIGGKTHFNELSGYLQLANGRYQYRQLKLLTGMMSANGNLEFSAERSLSGNLVGELHTRATVLRTPFTLSGTLATPTLKVASPSQRAAPVKAIQEDQ